MTLEDDINDIEIGDEVIITIRGSEEYQMIVTHIDEYGDVMGSSGPRNYEIRPQGKEEFSLMESNENDLFEQFGVRIYSKSYDEIGKLSSIRVIS